MILIRADANGHIGTGHIMRCLSIARAFASFDEDVLFVTADHQGDDLILEQGFQTVCLESSWDRMEEGELDKLVDKLQPEMVLFDSYYVSEQVVKEVSCLVKTVYLDDLNIKNLPVDALINYNIFSEEMDYSCYQKMGCRLLLGPVYAPLRTEFLHHSPRNIKESIKEILVCAGGSDPEGISEKLMSEICPKWGNSIFHFIIGSLNPRLEHIKEAALHIPNVVLHINEHYMADVMERCDAAICAAGSTLYELCACGTPAVAYSLADNQILAARQFDKYGLMISAGDCRHNALFIQNVENALQRLDYETRKKMTEKMQTLVDGKGAERIASELLAMK